MPDPASDDEIAALRFERDQYAAAIRHIVHAIRWTAYHWSQAQPETLRRDDVIRALGEFAGQLRPLPEELRDDLWQRTVGAYYVRFENDGHPEDARAAADLAVQQVRPELDALRARLDRVAALHARLADPTDEITRERAAELLAAALDGPTACGRTRSVGGREYPPCTRRAGHRETYCRAADGGALFLARL